MRYSFLSLESGNDPTSVALPVSTPNAEGAPRGPEPDEAVRLITGEYAKGENGRLARMRLTEGRSTLTDVHVPAITEMQGAVVHNGVWFVNASRGDKRGGDLWVGTPGKMVRHTGVLPPGPEDNAVWADHNQIWSVTEFPGKRWIYAVELDRWRNGPAAH